VNNICGSSVGHGLLGRAKLLCWRAGRFSGRGDPCGVQPLSVRQTTVRGESKGVGRSRMDAVLRGVVRHLMLSSVLPGLKHGPSQSLRALRWVHKAPPAVGTRVKPRRCSRSQQAGGTQRSRFGARDVGVGCLSPPFFSSQFYSVLQGQAGSPTPLCDPAKGGCQLSCPLGQGEAECGSLGFWDPCTLPGCNA